MLEGLDSIDWKSLEHAYGEASDVPELIRSLASEDSEVRAQALWNLYGNIFHQGTRYEATAYAVPFIFELLMEPSVFDKTKLIKYLIDLALGFPNAHLPYGFNLKTWQERLQYWREKEQEEELSSDEKYWIKVLKAYVSSYKAVLEKSELFLKFITNKDEEIRVNATFALAWFREKATLFAPEVRKILKKENNPKNIANLILTLGMLDFYLEDSKDIELFRKYLSEEPSELIQISSAIALATILKEKINDEVVEFLLNKILELATESKSASSNGLSSASLEASTDDGTFSAVFTSGGMGPFEEFPWNDGDLLGYISLILNEFGSKQPEKIVPIMCEALKKGIDGIPAHTLTNVLLSIAFQTSPKGDMWTTEELTEIQKLVLKTLADSPKAWTLNNMDYGNFTLMMRNFLLPSSIDSLQKFLVA